MKYVEDVEEDEEEKEVEDGHGTSERRNRGAISIADVVSMYG